MSSIDHRSRVDPSHASRYRSTLERAVGDADRRVCFVLLNPSTADETRDDPTVRRCVGFARRWGCGSLEIVNLFSHRATDPRMLRRAADPVGPGNDAAIARAVRRADLVVLGWGNHARWSGRGKAVWSMIHGVCEPHALGVTRLGEPRHPLYAPGSRVPQPVTALPISYI